MGRNRVISGHQSNPLAAADLHAPAANNPAVITYAAFPGAVGTAAVGNQPVPAGYPVPAQVSHVISGFRATVFATASLATLPNVTITDGSTVVFDTYLTPVALLASTGIAYVADIVFPLPKRGTAGKALVVTVSNPGSGNIAKLIVYNHWTEIN